VEVEVVMMAAVVVVINIIMKTIAPREHRT
jgi:hypothetical protein